MSEPLDLTCRCGWLGHFNTAQIGMTIACPECERSVLITDDAALFRSKNIGDDDFSFMEDLDEQARNDELPRGASPHAALPPKIGRLASARVGPAAKAPRRGAGGRGSGARGAGRGRRGKAGGGARSSAPAYHAAAPPGGRRSGPTRSQRKTRHQLGRQSRGSRILLWVALGGVLTVVSVGGCLFYAWSLANQIGSGVLVAVEIAEGAVAGIQEQHGHYFERPGAYTDFCREVQRIKGEDPDISVMFADAVVSSADRFDVKVDLIQSGTTHRITFDMVRRDHDWVILRHSVEKLSAAQRAR